MTGQVNKLNIQTDILNKSMDKRYKQHTKEWMDKAIYSVFSHVNKENRIELPLKRHKNIQK